MVCRLMRRRVRAAAAAVLVAGAFLYLRSHPAAQQPMFRSATQVVSLFVTVTDAQRRLVPGLEQADFQVFDNDKVQPLILFENKLQPITVVVMLDTSASMTNAIELLKQAAEQFVLKLLPDDRAAVGAFNDKIQFGSHFTNDRETLISSTRDLDFGNGTRLYDAIGASLDELSEVVGRKVILVFTDGDDTSSRVSLGNVIDRARADEVMVYAIGFESEYFNGARMVRSKPDRGLRKLADETGGGYFELQRSADLAPTFTQVALELHSQYVIGFAPTSLDGRVHKLAVKMTKPGLTARARRSYLAAPERPSP
jgi:Ca-activated chloride channel family protein